MLNAIYFTPPIEANYLSHQLTEVYTDGIYEPLLNGRRDLTIVDLGANVGVTAYYFAKFARVVYAVEPATEHFQALREMIEYNDIRTIVPIKKAVGITNGTTRLIKNQVNLTLFSTNPIADEGIEKQKWPRLPDETVEVVTLDKLFEENKIEHCDFMKMDIEGSEADVFNHSSFAEVAPKIDTIVFEMHSWNGRHPNQVNEALKNNGFKVSTIALEGDKPTIMVAQR